MISQGGRWNEQDIENGSERGGGIFKMSFWRSVSMVAEAGKTIGFVPDNRRCHGAIDS